MEEKNKEKENTERPRNETPPKKEGDYLKLEGGDLIFENGKILRFGAGTKTMKLDYRYGFWTGDETYDNAPVKIANSGTITARINPRTNTVASSATPSINTDTTDIFTITALAAAITSMTSGLSGTPVNGQKLIIRILDNGTARGITWGTSFAARGVALPTTTVLSKYLYVGFIFNSATSTFDCVASAQEA